LGNARQQQEKASPTSSKYDNPSHPGMPPTSSNPARLAAAARGRLTPAFQVPGPIANRSNNLKHCHPIGDARNKKPEIRQKIG
jgi:hypothetical protein